MATGVIKKLVMNRGFGFISPDSGEADIFFHCTALPQKSDFDSLQEGQRVAFIEVEGRGNRVKAENIQVLD